MAGKVRKLVRDRNNAGTIVDVLRAAQPQV